MQSYPTNTSKGNRFALLLALPLLVVAVAYVDNLRALTTNRSLIELAAEAWQDQALDETLSAHYVQLDDQNRLTGTVSAIRQDTYDAVPVSGLDVKLVRQGQPVASSVTDAGGMFTTGVVQPGAYTLCISGQQGFLAYGVQVVESATLGQEFELPSPDDAATMETPSASPRQVLYRTAQDDPIATRITAAVIPPTHTALKEIMDGLPIGSQLSSVSENATRINVEKSVVARGFQVTLRPDGTLVGRLAPLQSPIDTPIRFQEMNVYLIQSDEIRAQVIADPDGNFVFSDVDPGVYGFAAVGRDGFAALSFQALEATDESNARVLTGGSMRNAAATSHAADSNSLNVALCPPEDIPYLRSEIDNLVAEGQPLAARPPLSDSFIADSTLSGGYAGGGSGGGGGFAGSNSGLTGFGGLLEAALAAWVLSEIFNDNDNTTPLPPVSPFQASTVPNN